MLICRSLEKVEVNFQTLQYSTRQTRENKSTFSMGPFDQATVLYSSPLYNNHDLYCTLRYNLPRIDGWTSFHLWVDWVEYWTMRERCFSNRSRRNAPFPPRCLTVYVRARRSAKNSYGEAGGPHTGAEAPHVVTEPKHRSSPISRKWRGRSQPFYDDRNAAAASSSSSASSSETE